MKTDAICAFWALTLTVAALVAVLVDDRDMALSIRNVAVLTSLILVVFDTPENAWPFLVPAFVASFRRE